jgi:hypothetical protein
MEEWNGPPLRSNRWWPAARGGSTLQKLVRIVWGVLLVLVGIVGIVMPIMPGWVFIIPGLVILSDYFPPVRRLLNWAKQKYEEHRPKPKI